MTKNNKQIKTEKIVSILAMVFCLVVIAVMCIDTDVDDQKIDGTNVVESSADEPSADEPSADKSSADDSSADEPNADDSSADEPNADDSSADEPSANDSSADDSSADESSADEPSADESSLDKSKIEEPKMDEQTADEIINIGGKFKILQTGKYSGPYLEDGSNEEVSGIQMIVLENITDQDLQYAEITVEHENVTAEYAVTNLPAGQKVLILEKNRMKYTKQDVKSTKVSNVVFFEEMQLYENIFQIQGLEEVINVTNITENDVSNDIYIYYKNIGEEMYLGGITYRVKIEGGLKAGEIRQLGVKHFNAETCEILMVSGLE